AAAPRVLAEVAKGLRVDRFEIDHLREPISEIEVELARGAAPEPLAVPDDDVERRRLVAEVEKDLILVVAPGNLLHLDGDTRFLLVVAAELLEAVGRCPLGPPDRDGARGLLVPGGGLRLARRLLFFASGQCDERKRCDEAEHPFFHEYLLGGPLDPRLV